MSSAGLRRRAGRHTASVALALLVLLLLPPPAQAGAPAVAVALSAGVGQAPFAVTLTAAGDAASYRWDLGDGTFAEGPSVQHVYAAGLWTATVTATGPDGASAQAQAVVRAESLTLAGPARATYHRTIAYRGALVPAQAEIPVTLAAGGRVLARGLTGSDGSFRLRATATAPGRVVAAADRAVSQPVPLAVAPLLTVALRGRPAVYGELHALVRVRPAAAGTVAVRVHVPGQAPRRRSARSQLSLRLRTSVPGRLVVAAETRPAAGWLPAAKSSAVAVLLPRLAEGTSGAAVAVLRRSLAALDYALPPPSTVFDGNLLDAVYAFEKVQDLARTGVVDAAFWRKLEHPRRPRPRYRVPADHLEVDKPHQVLYVVRHGRIASIAPVSTAGLPGRFTPVGRFAIYRKVVGFDPSPLGTLYDPLYFTGGYAIHGNPTVPPYPASHGCVRVPMWLAPTLFATNGYGETVYVY
jgi:N-acetylmuramoyl-L-alanine amidase